MKSIIKSFQKDIKATLMAVLFIMFYSAGFSQLNGTYKIGPPDSIADFHTFTEVADTLNAPTGISGPVVFNVLPGIYNVHIQLGAIVGNNQTNTMTFQGSTGDSTEVIITYSYTSTSADNYMITLNGTQYVTFKSMTFDASSGNSSYCKVFRAIASASHINFLNNVFHGKPRNYYDDGTIIHFDGIVAEYIVIKNNVFNQGEKAAYYENNSTYARGNNFSNNICIDQEYRAVLLKNQDAPVVTGNYIRNSKSAMGGMQLTNFSNNYEVSNNDIFLNDPVEGIYLNACDGGASLKGKVYNNFISMSGAGSSNYGLRLLNCDHVQIYHNSVYHYNGWKTDSRTFFQDGGSDIDIRNNIFANYNGGYAYYIDDPGSISTSDYNNYYATGNYMAYWGGNKLDLPELAGSHSGDNHSISTHPVFFAGNDLHTSNFRLEAKGDPTIVSLVPKDIDGDSRSGSPDLGADEFGTPTGAALSGTITIGPGQVYETILSAISQLNKYGVSGPVILNLLDDGSPYEEQFNIQTITGADASNTVTLQPDPSNDKDVIISFNPTSEQQVISFWRASYFNIKNLVISNVNATYPEVIRFNGYCHHDSIIGCKLNSVGTQSGRSVIYSTNDYLGDIYIIGNEIVDAETSIWLEGTSNTRFENIVIKDNLLESPYSTGVYLVYCDAPVVNGNTINTGATTYYYNAIYLYNCRFNLQVVRNNINNLYYDTGIYLRTSDGSLGKEGLVANNFIRMSGPTGRDATGIYTNGSDYVNIVFNTVRIDYTNDQKGSDAYYNTGGSFINIMNNIFCQYGTGRAINNNTTNAFGTCDYNCYYSPGNFIARWGNTDKTTLEGWQTASGKDAHSVFADPAFKLTSDDLHVNSFFLDGKGIDFDTITVDIDGELRNDPPDIGADEFSDPLTPLAGTYTIGGNLPDYNTIKDARDDLHLKGISASVTFNIRSGEYNERLGSYYPISGANARDTIVIQSESGDPGDVTIYSGDEVTLTYIRGCRYITIKNLTLSSTSASAGNPISVRGYIKNLNIINNRLISANTAWTNIHFNECITDSILIKDNLISKGYHAIYVNGDQNSPSTKTRIIGNDLSGTGHYGMWLIYQQTPVIIHNIIKNTTSNDFNGIRLENSYADLVISSNTITSTGYYGIYLNNCDAVSPFYGLITNNMIQIGGTYTADGIYLNSCDRMYVYHNSVHITSTHKDYGYAIYVENNNNETALVNNIFANSGNGRAAYIEDGVDISVSDYNNFYSKAADRFIRLGSTDHLTLAAYKNAAGGKDAHSLSVDPLFYSINDLHSEQPLFFEAGTPLADVPYDIDSVSRTLTVNPDIGAAEFTCGPPVFNIAVSPTCFGDSTTFIDNSTNIARASTFSWDFDGDFEPDYTSTKLNDTIIWFFDSPGDYTTYLTVTQLAGCVDYEAFDVTVFAPPEVEISTVGAYCGEEDGEASVNVTEGNEPYTYFWSTGETDTLITDLALGTYTVAVSDKNGCTTTNEFIVDERIQVIVTQIKESTCGIPDGAAVVTATGGVEPYDYIWSNGVIHTDTNSTMSTGVHYVNVIDDNGCYAQGFINITSDESGPQVSLVHATNNNCYGDRNGAISISVSGGVEPYSYYWSNGAVTQNIEDLAAGIYDVLITANDGCMGSGSFEVKQPARITVNTVIEDASCAGADGRAVAVVSGGTKPYSYQWSTGGIFQLEEGLAAGIYSVTITDGRGCKEVTPVFINNIGGPVVTLTEVTGASCSNPVDGAINIGVAGGEFPFSYKWSPGGQITQDISGLSPGVYGVKVTDKNGCVGVLSVDVEQSPPAVNPICLVTVDTITGKNMVVWEKVNTTDVDYYVIYRESSLKGIYQPVGTRSVDSVSVFIDDIADPTIRSWRYKLSVVDVCGVESDQSEHHKTMHLTMNLGLNDVVNLIWDHYEGFDVNTYKVWRFSETEGWKNIANMPANLTSYTDVNPPGGFLTYYIEVEHPTGCTPTELKAGTLNSSRSNRQNRLQGTGIHDLFDNLHNLSIYPNPGDGRYNISLDKITTKDLTIKIYDLTGKLVFIKDYRNIGQKFETSINLSDFANGIYHFHLKTDNTLYHRVLIKD